MANDLAIHAAAGEPWLGQFPIPRPLRIAIIENEGSRARFRTKLRRKGDSWPGATFGDNIFVCAEPWGRFTLRLEECRTELAGFLDAAAIDLLIAGPLVGLGAGGAGTPDDVYEFESLLSELRGSLKNLIALILIHHENKTGDISGAWSRLPDTLLRLQNSKGRSATLDIRKARHASRVHGTRLKLELLPEIEGYRLSETIGIRTAPSEPDPEALEWIANFIESENAESRGVSADKTEVAYRKAHEGAGRNLVRRVIKREVACAADWHAGRRLGERPVLMRVERQGGNGSLLVPYADQPSPPADLASG